MTEEEIRPIAENYVEEYCHCPDGEYTDGSLVCAGIGTALIVSRQLEKRITDLEKENAELKSGCGMCYRKDRENLTKAKEIIKYLLSFIQKENYKTRWDINITEAEQFINEVEK